LPNVSISKGPAVAKRNGIGAVASLTTISVDGVSALVDTGLLESDGILVAFSMRHGGRSTGPYASLNLAAHVGDDPALVDENRARFLAALGIAHLRDRLTTAEQVHGITVRAVTGATAGMGARARADSPPPAPATDGLLTIDSKTPLLLLFADCVPVVLVARGSVPGVAVLHAGWRGALGGIPGHGARRLMADTGCRAEDITAYIGPYIGPCHYETTGAFLSQFTDTFGTIVAPQGRLDLGAVVSESLNGVGVPVTSMVRAGICTAERTDAFYSYRAEGGLTGRHGALACILGGSR
jgi:YfiH family protein